MTLSGRDLELGACGVTRERCNQTTVRGDEVTRLMGIYSRSVATFYLCRIFDISVRCWGLSTLAPAMCSFLPFGDMAASTPPSGVALFLCSGVVSAYGLNNTPR